MDTVAKIAHFETVLEFDAPVRKIF